jgi:hypothetical protein
VDQYARERSSIEGVILPAAMRVPAKVISLVPAKPVIIIGLQLPADDLIAVCLLSNWSQACPLPADHCPLKTLCAACQAWGPLGPNARCLLSQL